MKSRDTLCLDSEVGRAGLCRPSNARPGGMDFSVCGGCIKDVRPQLGTWMAKGTLSLRSTSHMLPLVACVPLNYSLWPPPLAL